MDPARVGARLGLAAAFVYSEDMSTPSTVEVEALQERIEALEEQLKEARRRIASAERNLGEQLIGDLVELAKRARTEFKERWAAAQDPRLNHLEHHATAYEFVAYQIQQFLKKREAAAAAEAAEREKAGTVEDGPVPQTGHSRFGKIDVD